LPNLNLSDITKKIMGNLPGRRGGGGGGGGGGGDKKWKMPPALRARVEETLSRNIEASLDGIGNAAYVQEEAKRLKTWYAVSFLNEATNKTSASIFRAAAKSGEDPGDKIMELADSYNRAVAILGEAQAKMALEMYDSLESFQQFVDELEAAQEHARRVEDWKFDQKEMSNSDYLAALRQRLVGLEEYSDEWMDIMAQIRRIEQEVVDETKAKQQEEIDNERKLRQRKLALQEITLTDYLAYLRGLLSGYEKYSDEWWDIHNEIEDAEKNSADTAKSWADAVADALRQAFDSVVGPIKSATSLISAFGDQANVSFAEVQGFYDHMKEGTQRWVDAIRTLRERGLNSQTLNELISAGPQSLSFAESLVSMGQDGVSFINGSVSDINAMASGLGSDIAQGSVGTVIQNQSNFDLSIGDVTLTFDPTGTTLTIEDVRNAINTAFSQFANTVNR
jgi:hypothetical protein